MSKLATFLEELTDYDYYHAEVVDSLAEIYIKTESMAIAMIEEVKDDLVVNFRVDMPVEVVANIVQDFMLIDEDFTISEAYMQLEESILYGEEADAAFYTMIHDVYAEGLQEEEYKKNGEVIFVVEEPITAYADGDRNERKRKMQRLWFDY